MKTLILVVTLLLLSLGMDAQKNTSSGSSKNIEMALRFDATQMTYANKKIMFTGLPYLPKATWAYLTDATGEVIKQHRVDPYNSELEVKHLQEGLYFVTLIYHNRGQKSFMLTICNNR